MAKDISQEIRQGILRLHNNFIEAIFLLTVDAKKLLLAILLHIDGDNGKNIKIYRKDICDQVGIDLKELNNKHREALIEELMTTIVTIRELDNKDNWTKIQLIGKTFYKDGYLETSIDKDLMPYILEARERLFTRFNIQNIKPLTSIHAIRIYLLAKQFDDTGWREIGIDEFKKMMELENKYSRIFDLKRKVLEVAKNQINKNTDIKIDYELIKESRRYTKIRFKISRDNSRVERTENKKLIAQNKYEELEQKLNGQYKGKSFRGENGLNWIVNQIQVLNENEVEITATDLQHTTSFVKKIYEIEELFNA